MKEGDRWELIIPPDLGYGIEGAGNTIPPDSTLIFEVELFGIENRLEQVLANLLDNAVSFSPNNSKIIIDVESNKEAIFIKIKDVGPGFNEINTEKIFKRFYSNRPEKFGEHSGLGLNIVKSIVEMHGGKVRAINRSDAKTGAEIELQLPKRG